MPLPLSYNVRNVRVRWRVTVLAISGIALVVAVFGVLMSMSEGFLTALRSTGRPDNAIIVHRGTASEMTSEVRLEQRKTILNDDRLARGPDGEVLASWESVTVIALPKKSDGRRTNVVLRAVPPQAFEVRGGIHVTAGRPFNAGLDEVIVGRRIMDRVRGLALGGTLIHRRKEFRIVGVFESEGAAFESEVWGDFATLNSFLHRGAASNSLVVRMKDPAEIPALDRWIRSQLGMPLQALPERRYYENQAGHVTTALKALAALVAVVMGAGRSSGP
jgi:putative ABC transport system permease protein